MSNALRRGKLGGGVGGGLAGWSHSCNRYIFLYITGSVMAGSNRVKHAQTQAHEAKRISRVRKHARLTLHGGRELDHVYLKLSWNIKHVLCCGNGIAICYTVAMSQPFAVSYFVILRHCSISEVYFGIGPHYHGNTQHRQGVTLDIRPLGIAAQDKRRSEAR